jgi:tetratricopeptide (TPR) repeat protein
VVVESGIAYRTLASVYCGQQNAPKALAALARAIDLFERLAAAHPDGSNYRIELARTHRLRGVLLHSLGQPAAAEPELAKTVDLLQTAALQTGDKELLNELAWFLADCQCSKFRDPTRAIRYAKQAIALAPEDRRFWNTLGVAHYRAGDLSAAAAALRKSMDLKAGGDPYDWFFLAMIHWQQGDRAEAHAWFDKSVAWMYTNTLMTEELIRYQAEAAAMLGREDAKPPHPR